jgi:hypothetical protein
VSNHDGALELYLSSPEVSEDEDETGGSAGATSLNVGGNSWFIDDSLNSLDPRSFNAAPVRESFFTFPVSMKPRNERDFIDCVNLFFHNRLFSTMVEHTNANIADDADKFSEEDVRRFVGVMFAMTICPMSNIEDYWNTADDGLMPASRFCEKLHMFLNKFEMIRKNWAIACIPRGSKTFDGIRPLLACSTSGLLLSFDAVVE